MAYSGAWYLKGRVRISLLYAPIWTFILPSFRRYICTLLFLLLELMYIWPIRTFNISISNFAAKNYKFEVTWVECYFLHIPDYARHLTLMHKCGRRLAWFFFLHNYHIYILYFIYDCIAVTGTCFKLYNLTPILNIFLWYLVSNSIIDTNIICIFFKLWFYTNITHIFLDHNT